MTQWFYGTFANLHSHGPYTCIKTKGQLQKWTYLEVFSIQIFFFFSSFTTFRKACRLSKALETANFGQLTCLITKCQHNNNLNIHGQYDHA